MPASQSSWGPCKSTSAGLAVSANASRGSRVESTESLSSRTLSTHQSCGGHAGLELLRIWCLIYWHCTGTASPRPKKLPVLWFIVLTHARWNGKFKQSLKQHDPQPMRSFGRKDVKKCYSYATYRYSSCKEMFKTGSEELMTWAHNQDRHQETYILTKIFLSQVCSHMSISRGMSNPPALDSPSLPKLTTQGSSQVARYQLPSKKFGESAEGHSVVSVQDRTTYMNIYEQQNVSTTKCIQCIIALDGFCVIRVERQSGRQNATVAVLFGSFLVRVAKWSGGFRLCVLIDQCLSAGEEELACMP